MITYLKLLFAAFFWGGTFIAGRIVSRSIDPYSAAFVRFTIASIFLLLFIRMQEGKFPRLSWKQLGFMVCLGMSGVFAYNVFFFSGLQTVTAGRASLIIALNPIVISVCSSIFFRERLTPIKILGILLSVTGAMYVITYGDLTKIFEKSMGQGELFIFGAVVSWATYSLIGKVVLSNLSPLVSVGYSSLVGAIALMVPAVYRGFFNAFTTYTLEQWFSLFYLGFFGTVLGFLWYYQAINRVGPMKSSVFINFVPVSAIVLAYIILNEPITASLVIGALLVICGVILANFSYLLLKLFKRI